MLKWMRGKRFDLKTTIFLLVLGAIFWGVFTYVNIKTFVPEELKEPVGERR